jgi:hypothetical protein
MAGYVWLTFVVARLAVRIVSAFFRAIETGARTFAGIQPDTAEASRRIVTVLIWIFALTAAYEYIPGSATDSFKAIGIFTGLMVSLGSAGPVNHLMSGLVVVYSRALRPGELIQSGEVVGRVGEVGLLSTKIVTLTREEVTIPNAVLAGAELRAHIETPEARFRALSDLPAQDPGRLQRVRPADDGPRLRVPARPLRGGATIALLRRARAPPEGRRAPAASAA